MLAESVGLVGVEDLPEGLGGDISQRVLMILIITAWQYFTCGSDDATRPEAEAQSAKGAVYGVWCRV